MSSIATPPTDRRAVRTFVTRFDPNVVKEAIERELARGGQVYFLHNRVESIDELNAMVRELRGEPPRRSRTSRSSWA